MVDTTRLRMLIAESPAGPVLRRVRRRLTERSKAERMNAKYDRWTRQVIARVLSADSNCIDVGAHAGEVLRDIVAAAPRGHHMAIEPLPDFAATLRDRYEAVEVLQVALSDSEGTKEFFHVVNAAAYSGLKLREFDRPDESVEKIDVRVCRLDEIVPTSRVIRFVKIDVEGGELGVLRGGSRTLKANRPYIAFEHGAVASSAYGASSEEIYDLLVDETGLKISLLSDWLDGRPALSRQSFIDQKNFFFLAHPDS